jgi:hypothetical protein
MFGHRVGDHQRAAIDDEFAMHDALAVLHHHALALLFGAERVLVEFDGGDRALRHQMRRHAGIIVVRHRSILRISAR